MKKEIGIGLLFFLGGILTTELMGEELVSQMGFMTAEQLCGISENRTYGTVFWEVFWQRGKLFVLWLLLCSTTIRSVLPKAVSVVGGYLCGMFACAMVLWFGIRGVGVMLLALPPALIYLGIGSWIYRKRTLYTIGEKKRRGRSAVQWSIVLCLLIAGCIIECYPAAWCVGKLLAAG